MVPRILKHFGDTVGCVPVYLSGSQETDMYWSRVTTQDGYISIERDLRGQLGIDHTPDCMTKAGLKSVALRCLCERLCCLSLWKNLTSLL